MEVERWHSPHLANGIGSMVDVRKLGSSDPPVLMNVSFLAAQSSGVRLNIAAHCCE